MNDEVLNNKLFAICHEIVCDLLRQSASEVENSTSDLSTNFQNLAQSTGRQSGVIDKLIHMVNHLEHNDGAISLADFMSMMEHNISDTISKIVNISENAMTLAFAMEDVVEQLDGIEQFVQKVNKINKETRMLALNATIEAARAGDAGHGFAVVANEVKEVSMQVDSMANEMQTQITQISKTLRAGRETLGKVAGMDLSSNITARSKLDELMKAMLKQNEKITSTMQESSEVIKQISGQIAYMTVGIQFQDRNTQIIDNVINLLLSIREHEMSPSENELPDNAQAALEQLTNKITLSAFKNMIFEKAASKGIEVSHSNSSNISIFNNNHASEATDDIELF
jgi:methyl-accepting chemotaxis protein